MSINEHGEEDDQYVTGTAVKDFPMARLSVSVMAFTVVTCFWLWLVNSTGKGEDRVKATIVNDELIIADPVDLNATFYHPNLIGQEMANRQPFSQLNYTCATSKMFALGEWLKVVNMENGRQVVVIVTDRHDNLTDIDLSFQAYATLRDYDGTTDSGNIPVRIERVVQ